jgi:hypothetical protein
LSASEHAGTSALSIETNDAKTILAPLAFGPGFGLKAPRCPMPNVETLLRDHVTLQLDCIDRLYLNGYVPGLQRPAQLWRFLHLHRKHPILSPALLKKMTDTFVSQIEAFAANHKIPIIRFERGERK